MQLWQPMTVSFASTVRTLLGVTAAVLPWEDREGRLVLASFTTHATRTRPECLRARYARLLIRQPRLWSPTLIERTAPPAAVREAFWCLLAREARCAHPSHSFRLASLEGAGVDARA